LSTKKILVMTHAGGALNIGPNTRWYYLGQALKPLGVNVEIVSSSNFHKYIKPPTITSPFVKQNIDGLNYHWVRTRPYSSRGINQVFNQIDYVLGCYRFQKMLCDQKPDVVIASSPHPLVNFPAASIARKTGADLIFEVRDLWPEVLLQMGNFNKWHPYILMLKYAEKYGVKRARKIISVKPGDIEYFKKEYNISDEQFCYIPNGFLPDNKTSSSPEIIKSIREQYSFLVGYVGALSVYYGLEHLIELARRFNSHKEVGFVIVGKGDLESSLMKKIQKNNLTNCHLVGAFPKKQATSCLEHFDACYVGLQDLAVHEYGISCNKIYEYMYAGKPILGSYVAGYDPVAEAQCGITAPPGDYDSLFEGLNILIMDKKLRHLYGTRAKKYFEDNHNFNVVAKKFVREILQ
jgi:glycosyltransferase involved in cell wall biosynthesis